MKKLILLLIIELTYVSLSQELIVYDIETTNYPIMKAKFYVFDAEGNQITNQSITDFLVTENGEQRRILNISCPSQTPVDAISSVLVMDA